MPSMTLSPQPQVQLKQSPQHWVHRCRQSSMADTRAAKRACTANAEESYSTLPSWRRIFHKLKIQEHMQIMLKLMMGLSIPLMFILRQILSMMMKVCDAEEMDVMKDMMDNMVTEAKEMEKGRHRRTSKSSRSTGSFEWISQASGSSTAPAKSRSSRRDKKVEMNSPTSSPTPSNLQETCYCGLPVVELICRKEGPNFQRKSLRCPRIHHPNQCEYFMWIESTKAKQYQRMNHDPRAEDHGASMQHKSKHKGAKKRYETSSSEESSSSEGTHAPGPRQSGAQPSHRAPHQECSHQWNRRGTNAYQRVKTATSFATRTNRPFPQLGSSGESPGRQEEGASSSSQPMTLRSGVRKRMLGLLQQKIHELENQPPSDADVEMKIIPQDYEEIMQLRLIGEVFSPDRFVCRASKYGLIPGKAFDLTLGDQFLNASERQKCLKHIRENHYGLIVVTPPCTMYSLLQYLGSGRSKESLEHDPVFQEKLQQANVLMTFAAFICKTQMQLGGAFLFEQPWAATSWRLPCIRNLLNSNKTILVRTDQCMFGQQDSQGYPIRKRKGFMTNDANIAKVLRRTCRQQHEHQPCTGAVRGMSRAFKAARYTSKMVNAILRAWSRTVNEDECPSSIDIHAYEWINQEPEPRSVLVQHRLQSRFNPEENHECFVVDPTELSVPVVPDVLNQPLHMFPSEVHPLKQLTEEEVEAVQNLSPQ